MVFGGSGVGGTGNLNLADLDGTNGFKLSGVSAYAARQWRSAPFDYPRP